MIQTIKIRTMKDLICWPKEMVLQDISRLKELDAIGHHSNEPPTGPSFLQNSSRRWRVRA